NKAEGLTSSIHQAWRPVPTPAPQSCPQRVGTSRAKDAAPRALQMGSARSPSEETTLLQVSPPGHGRFRRTISVLPFEAANFGHLAIPQGDTHESLDSDSPRHRADSRLVVRVRRRRLRHDQALAGLRQRCESAAAAELHPSEQREYLVVDGQQRRAGYG